MSAKLTEGAWALLVALALLATPALAVLPDEQLPDPVLEARARSISAEIRCVVCQNQSIDDSDAPLARDLRLIVRERLKAGDSDDAVKSYLTDRYGSFVLLKPPFQWDTALLWLGPAVVVLLGSLGIATLLRRRRVAETVPLSAAEEAALDALVERKSP
ncbi:cytochrome c-type biogenesis protein [Sandaracinobacteroides saxicola]|uniref:cytochrome c-type biogenesis protein n=1 Tax=Sandaracinobacteroides saxicola TaxID=2759707 RepID=UPI001FB1649B|nr:cytochrome c-type biogenesis protein [Sandaracinobacteroides saxicola]